MSRCSRAGQVDLWGEQAGKLRKGRRRGPPVGAKELENWVEDQVSRGATPGAVKRWLQRLAWAECPSCGAPQLAPNGRAAACPRCVKDGKVLGRPSVPMGVKDVPEAPAVADATEGPKAGDTVLLSGELYRVKAVEADAVFVLSKPPERTARYELVATAWLTRAEGDSDWYPAGDWQLAALGE